MVESDFTHEALFYGSDEEFLAGALPLLRQGLEGGDPMLVAVDREKARLLRGELGANASGVEFVDMATVGRNPGRIISVWRDFLDRAPGGSAPRGVGEPVWSGRSPAELDECMRHEALLNVAFAGELDFSLLCPYDSAALDDEVLTCACDSHPQVVRGAGRLRSDGWADAQAAFAPFGGHLPDPPLDSAKLRFDREGLAAVREAIACEATSAGLARKRVTDMVVALSELAANSVMHGGGMGTVWIWRAPDALVAEVRDAGRIDEPLVGRLRPSLAQGGGRGLWMANQLCDLVQIRSGHGGTRVRIRLGLD